MRGKIQEKWLIFGVVAVGVFMATLDGSIVNVALPVIAGKFGVGVGSLQWVVTAYLLTIASLLPAFGRLADILGRGRVYSIGFLGFAAGSALCGLSEGVGTLVAFRVVQGIGAAIFMANGMAIVVDSFPPSERGRALGTIGSVVAVGSLTGPTLGGFMVGAIGWRSIFYINVPIGVGAYFLGRVYLPKGQRKPGEGFDYLGALLFASGIMALLSGLSFGQELGWGSPSILALFGSAVVILVTFLMVELRVRHPMIDMSLFKNPLYTAGNLAGFISFVSMFFAALLIPFYLADVRGFGPEHIGLVMLASPLAMFVMAPISGWLSDRIGPVVLTMAGMAVTSAGLVLLSRLGLTDSTVSIAARLALLGLGSALFQSPNNSAIMGSAPPHKSGVTGGIIATVRNVGMMVGAAASASIFEARLANLRALARVRGEIPPPPGFTPWQVDYASAVSLTMLIGAAVAALGIIASAVRTGKLAAHKGSGGPLQAGQRGHELSM